MGIPITAPNASPSNIRPGIAISGHPQITVHAAAVARISPNERLGTPIEALAACTSVVMRVGREASRNLRGVNPHNYGNFTVESTYVQFARDAAARHNLDPALVCAIVEQESAWNPWAVRYEPVFFAKYVAPLFAVSKIVPATNTEAYARAFSWGLMQVMGQSARERGFSRRFLSELCDPIAGLDAGCELFAHKLVVANGNVRHALALWNGGANADYAAEVLARMPAYAKLS